MGRCVARELEKVTVDFLRKKKQKIPKVKHSWNTFVNVKL